MAARACPSSPRPLTLSTLAAVLCSACGAGTAASVRVTALGSYAPVPVAVALPEAPTEAGLDRASLDSLQGGILAGLRGGEPGAAPVPTDGPPPPLALVVDARVVEARRPTQPADITSDAQVQVAGLLGLESQLDAGTRAHLTLTLRDPATGDVLGSSSWLAASTGDVETLLDRGARESGAALGKEIARRRGSYVTRHAADERFVWTPSPLLLEPGKWVVSNDELLLFHLGMGLHERVQLDLTLGALPLPAAGGGVIPAHGLIGFAGAGVLLLGAVDVGVKVKLLDETERLPGLSLSYDLVDMFVGAVGVGTLFVLGSQVGAAAGTATGGANLQFNLFTLAASKHFGRFHLATGAYLLDNHALLPQSAGAKVTTTTGGTESDTSKQIERFPTRMLPFVTVDARLAGWAHAIVEAFPRTTLHDSFAVTGLRGLTGGDGVFTPGGFSCWRLKFDVALAWVYADNPPAPAGSPDEGKPQGTSLLPLPWLGVGLYRL